MAIQSFYCVFIYALIAYITEIRSKQAFLGKEQSDKAVTKWLKIFETFPEGIALVRNNYIVYANQSLRYILELQGEFKVADDPNNEMLKRQLMESRIVPYTTKKDQVRNQAQSTSVWQFLAKNERGATFELPSRANRYDERHSIETKYITLNQVNVNLSGGGRDKIFIVRDVSHIIYLE